MLKSEKGQALPLVLIAVALGALVIPSFLDHTGTSLVGSRAYAQELCAQYAADSGAEHAIWNLDYGGLKTQVPDVGNSVNYTLDETINGFSVGVTVTKTDDKPDDEYNIVSDSGDSRLDVLITVKGSNVSILHWNYE